MSSAIGGESPVARRPEFYPTSWHVENEWNVMMRWKEGAAADDDRRTASIPGNSLVMGYQLTEATTLSISYSKKSGAFDGIGMKRYFSE